MSTPNIQPYVPNKAPDIEQLDPKSILRQRLAQYGSNSERRFRLGWNPNKRQWAIVVYSHGGFTEHFTEHGEVMIKREDKVISDG